MPLTRRTQARFAALAAALAGAFTLTAADWPQFRGPLRDGASTETELLTPWPQNGPAKLWSASVGTGSSGVAIAGGRLYTQGHVAGKEQIVCLDALTGKELWKLSYEAELLPEMHEGGPAATPTVSGKTVYTLGRDGQLFALNAENGSVVWNVALQKELKSPLPFFGFCGSPLEHGGKLYFASGRSGSSQVALDTANGSAVWKNGDDPCSYTSPVLYADGEFKAVLILTGAALVAHDPGTGKELARFPFECRSPMNSYVNAATPLVAGNEIFISAAYGSGSVKLKLERSAEGAVTFKELWRNADFATQYNTAVKVGAALYGFHSYDMGDSRGELMCLDWATGALKWQRKNPGRGHLIAAGNTLLIVTREGTLIEAEANAEKYTERDRTQVLGGTVRSDPALCNGLLYLRAVDGTLVCLDLRRK